MRAGLTVLILWAAGLGAAAQFGKISVLYEDLTAAYAAHAGVGIGLMVSIVGIVGMIFGTTAGLLVARVGPRRAMLAALILGAAVSLVQSSFPPYALMMLSRVLEGVSHLAIVVVAPTVIAAVTPARRIGLAMSIWSTFFGLTYALLFAISPSILGWGGPALLFRLHAVWLLICALLLWRLMPGDPAAPVVARGNLLQQHARIYGSPRLAAPASGFVFYTVTYVALLTLLPAAVSAGWGTMVGVGMPLTSIAVSLTLGVFLLSRFDAVHVARSGFGVAVLFGLALWLVWGRGAAEVAAAWGMAGALGLVQGASFASIPQLNHSAADRSAAAGAIAQLGNVGTTLGTPLLALTLAKAGSAGLVLFVCGFSLLGIGMLGWQARRRSIG